MVVPEIHSYCLYAIKKYEYKRLKTTYTVFQIFSLGFHFIGHIQ